MFHSLFAPFCTLQMLPSCNRLSHGYVESKALQYFLAYNPPLHITHIPNTKPQKKLKKKKNIPACCRKATFPAIPKSSAMKPRWTPKLAHPDFSFEFSVYLVQVIHAKMQYDMRCSEQFRLDNTLCSSNTCRSWQQNEGTVVRLFRDKKKKLWVSLTGNHSNKM